MEKLIEFVINNYQWIFSGIGIVVLSLWFKNRASTSQVQSSGKNSINIQSTGKIEVNKSDMKVGDDK